MNVSSKTQPPHSATVISGVLELSESCNYPLLPISLPLFTVIRSVSIRTSVYSRFPSHTHTHTPLSAIRPPPVTMRNTETPAEWPRHQVKQEQEWSCMVYGSYYGGKRVCIYVVIESEMIFFVVAAAAVLRGTLELYACLLLTQK